MSMFIPDTIVPDEIKTASIKVAKTIKMNISEQSYRNMIAQSRAALKLMGYDFDEYDPEKVVSVLMDISAQKKNPRALLEDMEDVPALRDRNAAEKKAKEVEINVTDQTYKFMVEIARQYYRNVHGGMMADTEIEDTISEVMEMAIEMGEIFTPPDMYDRNLPPPKELGGLIEDPLDPELEI